MKPKTYISDEEIEEARRQGEESLRNEPHAAWARYDPSANTLVMELRKGATVSIPVAMLNELRGATPRQLSEARASRFGDVIEFEGFDMHISVKGLMRDLVGFTGEPPPAAHGLAV
jgi:hypothetical protein